MLLASHTEYAPWTIIRSDDKKKARINCIKYILSKMEYADKIKDKKLVIDETICVDANVEIKVLENEMSSNNA